MVRCLEFRRVTVLATVAITVLAVDDAPVNTVPGAQVVNEDTALALGGVSVTDVDGNRSTVQMGLASGWGTVVCSAKSTISAGGNGTNSLTLSGSQVDINATLASLAYQGTLKRNGGEQGKGRDRRREGGREEKKGGIKGKPGNHRAGEKGAGDDGVE